jgi:hypothetical protein
MSKVTKSLIESCKRLKDKNLLNNKQYDECRVLDKKEKWLKIDSKKKVKDVYQQEIDDKLKAFTDKAIQFRNNINGLTKRLLHLNDNIINQPNNNLLKKEKEQLVGNINRLVNRIRKDKNQIYEEIYTNYGQREYKELVSKYQVVENNRLEETKMNNKISYSREKLIHEKNYKKIHEHRKLFNMILIPVLIIIIVILTILLLSPDLIQNIFKNIK